MNTNESAQSWKPAGYNSLSPYVISSEAEGAIAFMEKTFNASVVRRFDRPDGSLMHAEVRIDDTVVMIGGSQTATKNEGPHLHLYVKDVDEIFDRALKNGATIVEKPSRKSNDDDYRGGFKDAFGTTWWLGCQS